jgi:hypothetical protein
MPVAAHRPAPVLRPKSKSFRPMWPTRRRRRRRRSCGLRPRLRHPRHARPRLRLRGRLPHHHRRRGLRRRHRSRPPSRSASRVKNARLVPRSRWRMAK